MKTSQVRQKFLDFFTQKNHQLVPSSSLIPRNDPTLMFTVAGMVQFKDLFLGFEKRNYTRATSSQKCLRAGGKHNDLENVGYTARHHTFFEMLGNFSFGDYFKQEAISFAWEFLTDKEWLNLPKEKLLVTVYASDDEAYDIWHNTVGLPTEKIIRIGNNKGAPYASDNFWSMGETGPCGPCTEIFYDLGQTVAGGPPGSPNEDGDRFIEIWNNVFMQFNRDDAGTLHPLPRPSVDTGMGLERIAAVLQQVQSNYETDVLACLIRAAARETGVPYSQDMPSLKVIADHIRACAFMVVDGINPSNEGRGYVLRRIARRAIRHGYTLGQKKPFFHKIVTDLVEEMADSYPELREKQTHIETVLYTEEIKFAETLEIGMALLDSALEGGKVRLEGDTIFKLYDTFGFPVDLTAGICRERNIHADLEGFARAMKVQRDRARAGSTFKITGTVTYNGSNTHFRGYETTSTHSRVLALFKGTKPVEALEAGEEGIVVLNETPFYAEGGGQVGDVGEIYRNDRLIALFNVTDTQTIQSEVCGHKGSLSRGRLTVGDIVTATINPKVRAATTRNHSATHLLHTALRNVLGVHVSQKGSLVNSERTRFDFAHSEPVSRAQIVELERLINQVISQNLLVRTEVMSIDAAQKSGAMMLFGEKYGDEVRVVTMDNFSTELCGGTHVQRTGEIGLFKIVTESSVAAGTRRIEAITGESAITYIQTQENLLKATAHALKAQTLDEVATKINSLKDKTKTLEKELSKFKGLLVASTGESLVDLASDLNGIKVLAVELPGLDNATLRETLDKLKIKLGSAAIVLATQNDGKVSLLAGVTADLTYKLKAGELVNFVAQQVGGKGGGRADIAQAGGSKPDNLQAALDSIQPWVTGKL